MGGPGSVKADGTFELKSLSGARIIRAGNLPPGWMLKSVRVNGNDITDSGMDFKPGEAVNGIEVTLTAKLTEVNGTVKEVIRALRAEGMRIGSVSLCSFRPFPLAALRAAIGHAQRVVVLEKCLAVGLGGILSDGVRKSLSGIALKGYTVIAGLGGRAITRASLRTLFQDATRDTLEPVTFLDLNTEIVNRELEREKQARRTGPTAESILRQLGTVASRIA